jgi:hypothetical protein
MSARTQRLNGCVFVAYLLLALTSACSNPPQRQVVWLPYEKIKPSLRREIHMEPDQYVASCGSMINVGQFRTARDFIPVTDPNAYEEIVLSDGPSSFYDRRTGELVMECDFWYCTRHSNMCDKYCPPRAWTCSWEMP